MPALFKSKPLQLCLLILFTACSTLAYFATAPHYAPIGGNLLPALSELSAQHTDTLILENVDAKKSRNFQYIMDRPSDLPSDRLLFNARYSLENIRAGTKGWQRARIFLTSQSSTGKKWHWNLGSALINESHDTDKLTKTRLVKLPKDAHKIRLSIQLARTTGKLIVHEISLRPAAETNASKLYRDGLIALWSIIMLIILMSFWRIRIPLSSLTAIMLALFLLLAPHEYRTELKNSLMHSYQNAISQFKQETETADAAATKVKKKIKKPRPLLTQEQLGHFTLFALLSLALLIRNPSLRRTPVTAFVYLSLFACSSELLQNFSPGRTASFEDAQMNLAGIGIVFLPLLLWRNMSPSNLDGTS